MVEAPQRKYVLTKIGPGDYLLPSNDDGERIWRIAKYVDGPSHGLEEWSRDREVWGLYTSSLLNNSHGQLDRRAMDLDWAEWEMEDGAFETRQEAIDAAMRYDEKRRAG